MTRLKTRFLLLAAVCALALGLAACGGESASEVDVDQLLEETFSGDKKVDSGKLDLSLKLDAKGGGDAMGGPIDVKLSGPFESRGKAKLPKLDMDLRFTGAGQSITAGVATTGEKGFVTFNNQDYVVSDDVFAQFKSGYEEAAAKQGSESGGQSLATLGIDPRRWLENPRVDGEEKVGDADTYKITGRVNVDRLLDDVNTALAKAGSLGVQGTEQLPGQLTDEQKRQIREAVTRLEVTIHTGKDDKTLRRMVVALDVTVPEAQRQSAGAESAAIAFDVQITELNESQEISEPENPKPFDELLGQLGGLGGIGGLGGGATGPSGASGGSGAADEYSKCLEEAGGDLGKVQKCAEKLNP